MFDPKTTFTRRAFFLSGVQGLLGLGLLGRLYWLQIESNQHYKKLSDKNRLHSEFILPVRGQIFDRENRLLAGNRFIHRAILQRDQTIAWKKSLDYFAELLLLSGSDVVDIVRESAQKSKFMPIPIKDPLTWDDVAKIELHASDLPGIRVEQGQERFYPYAEDLCHLLGYVGKPSETEARDNEDLLLQHPGFRLGKSGIEKKCEGLLQGSPGITQVEVNATRQVVREVSSHEPKNGQDLTLSIHLDLQKRMVEHLKDFESATAVAMNVKSGALLAAVSVPGFDTNHFTGGIPKTIWEGLRTNPYTPLVTKFTQGQYAPGSTFKMIVALAGLHSKAIDERTILYCPGYYDLNNHRFHCVKHSGHGHLAMRDALSQSCDVYFYELSLRMGVDAIAAMAKMFGLGEKTQLQFPNEKEGLIPSKNWKERMQGKKWTPSETINTSIGQGYVLTTPLQLCTMTARLASKGQCVHPYITEASRTFDALPIDPKHLDLVFNGMRDVMSSPHGTAYASRSPLEGIEFAGKTGTSQVRRITMRDRELNLHHNWPWRFRDHALFVGFAPVIDPKIAVSVVIEHGGWGGKIAAPIGRDILVDALKLVIL